jgi:hypothetical protein
MGDYHWTQTDQTDLQNPHGPPQPDTETLLSELGAYYPVVSYPATPEQEPEEEAALDQAILAGVLSP